MSDTTDAPPRDPERWEKCMRLARTLLMVGDDDRDLVKEYLEILIDRGLPKTDAPKKVLIVGAGIAGLVSGWLLKSAGHDVTIIEANGNRIGGRLKTFRYDQWRPDLPSPFRDPRQYGEAGAMRLPNFHPLTLALVDRLGLKRRLFYNVDVEPGTGNGAVPPVVYRPFDGSGEWRNGPDVELVAPTKRNNAWIRVNGVQTRKREYNAAPRDVNASFGMPDALCGTTTNDLVNRAIDFVRDYYSEVGPDGKRVNKPFEAWVEGWARVIYDFDAFSMWGFLKEAAGMRDETIEAVGTIENLTSRLPLSFFHSFLGRSDINPNATYWEIEGGTWRLPYAFLSFLRDEIVLGRRMVQMEYWDPARDCSQCAHVGPDGPRVWINTVDEATDEDRGGKRARAPEFQAFTGDVAIVTVPFSSLRHVIVDPLLSYKKRRAIIELHYDSATKVLLEFSKRWWEFGEGDWKREMEAIRPGLHAEYEARSDDESGTGRTDLLGADPAVDETRIAGREKAFYAELRHPRAPGREASGVVGGGSITDNPNRFMYYPSHPVPGSEGGVVLASYSWADDAARWDSMSDDERYAFALRGLQAIHGRRIEVFYTGHGQTQSWLRNRYAFGEAAVFTPGQLTQLHMDIFTAEGPVHFAGEHTSLKHAWIEGAVESAVRAALEVSGGAPAAGGGAAAGGANAEGGGTTVIDGSAEAGSTVAAAVLDGGAEGGR